MFKHSSFAIVAILAFATIFSIAAGATKDDKIGFTHSGARIQSLKPVW
jgi:hypothetical protein